MKKIALLVCMSVLLTITAYSNVISFYIVETGLPENIDRHRSSMLWENAFLDVFFDAGFIVTNYPMLRLPEKPQENILKAAGFDLGEAQDAGIDYILIAQLDYSDPLSGPDEISFFVFRVTNHHIIYEKKIAGRNYRHERDAIDELRTIVRELVPVISMI